MLRYCVSSIILKKLFLINLAIILSSCSDMTAGEGSSQGSGNLFNLTSPADNTYVNSLTHNLTGTCKSGTPITIGGNLGGGPISIICDESATFSENINLATGDGSKTLTLSTTNPILVQTLTFNLDTTSPMAPTITSHTNNLTVSSVNQTLIGVCETNSTLSFSGQISGSPITTTCNSGNYSRAISLTNGDGSKSLSVTQTDLAGNTSTARNMSLNLNTNVTVPPAPTITSPANNLRTNSTSHTLTGSCVTGNSISISGAMTGSPLSTTCTSSSFSRAITLTSGDGSKSISVTQSNGNVSPAASVNIILDTTAPSQPTITSPSNASTVTATSQTITGNCETGATVSITGNITGSPVTTSCTSSSYSRAVNLTTGDGSKTLNVSQQDTSGNTSTLRTISITLSTTIVAPTISSPSNNLRTNSISQTITGVCISGNTVTVSGNITGSPLTTSCSSNAYSRAVSLTTGDAAKTINVTQTNGSITSPQASITINLDTTAPSAPTISSPSNGANVTATAQTITGGCETGATVNITGNITGAPLTVSCSSSSFSRSVTLTSGDGAKTLNFTQQDQAGNTSTSRSLVLNYQSPTSNPNWGPVNSTRLLLSGHSLTDNPLADYLEDVTDKTSDSFNYQQQIVIGSPMRVRTKGNDTGSSGWSGYAQGKNRSGNNLNFVNEVRNPQTLGSGERYDTLVITENHSSLGQIQWENTIGYLRHYHDLMISGNAATRTFFYHSWLDIDKSNPTNWITHETNSITTWECVASKVNQSLSSAGRTDRVRLLPAGGALVDLVERVIADEVSGITGSTTAKLNMIFSDNVHLTSLGMYYISLVVYASTYGKSPSGVSAPSGSGVNVTQASQLQSIAWNYVNAYYNQSGNPSERTMSSCRSFIQNNACISYWTLLGQTSNISGCQSFFGTNSTDNPFRDTVLIPFPAP